MNLQSLKANIKTLDPSIAPATSDAERDYFRHYNINFEEQLADIKHHFGHLDCGRFDLVVHYYEPVDVVATCFILHGYFDHAGLYGHVIEYCLRRHYAVVIFDLPGHGLSTGEPGSIASFQDYQFALRSVMAFFDGVASQPWYAIGQSTGGAILMDLVLSNSDAPFERMVLLAPLYRPTGWTSGRIMHAFAYPLVKKLRRSFQPNSHDDRFLDFVEHRDPLQCRYLSLTWVAALKQWIKHFDKLPATSFAPLIVQGKRDGTVDWQRNLPVIQGKFPNATLFFIQQGFHHLANESDEIRNTMFSAIDLYLDQAKGAGA